jgi:hypothetical protein
VAEVLVEAVAVGIAVDPLAGSTLAVGLPEVSIPEVVRQAGLIPVEAEEVHQAGLIPEVVRQVVLIPEEAEEVHLGGLIPEVIHRASVRKEAAQDSMPNRLD